MKIKKKAAIIILNVIILVIILYLQSTRYSSILSYNVDNLNQNDTLINVGLLHALGNDINLIFVISLILLVLNIILFKNWVKAKRWIIKPVIIFLITIGLTVFYQIKRVKLLKEEYKNIIENKM